MKLGFDQVSEHFGIGFGDKLMTRGDKFPAKFRLVFDDAVMDHGQLAGAVAVRVRVGFVRSTMCRPARMGDGDLRL